MRTKEGNFSADFHVMRNEKYNKLEKQAHLTHFLGYYRSRKKHILTMQQWEGTSWALEEDLMGVFENSFHMREGAFSIVLSRKRVQNPLFFWVFRL